MLCEVDPCERRVGVLRHAALDQRCGTRKTVLSAPLLPQQEREHTHEQALLGCCGLVCRLEQGDRGPQRLAEARCSRIVWGDQVSETEPAVEIGVDSILLGEDQARLEAHVVGAELLVACMPVHAERGTGREAMPVLL